MFVKKANLTPAFQHNEYVFEYVVFRSRFRVFGGDFKVFDGNKNLVFYSKQKVFKLKEDFRVYSDEGKTTELLSFKSDQIFDAGAKYTIHDSTTNEVVGSIRREMFESMLEEEWTFFSNDGQEIGKFTETSMPCASIQRVLNFIPFINIFSGLFLRQSYIIGDSDGEKIAEIKQQLTLFVLNYKIKYKMNIIEGNQSIDKRLLISMGILLLGIEKSYEL